MRWLNQQVIFTTTILHLCTQYCNVTSKTLVIRLCLPMLCYLRPYLGLLTIYEAIQAGPTRPMTPCHNTSGPRSSQSIFQFPSPHSPVPSTQSTSPQYPLPNLPVPTGPPCSQHAESKLVCQHEFGPMARLHICRNRWKILPPLFGNAYYPVSRVTKRCTRPLRRISLSSCSVTLPLAHPIRNYRFFKCAEHSISRIFMR